MPLLEAVQPPVARWDPFAPEHRHDPYPMYARYRVHEPVHYGIAPDGLSPGCWYITRHADAVTVLTNASFGLEIFRHLPPEHIPKMPDEFAPFFSLIQRWFIFRDPPDHTRLRGLVSRAFTPATVAAYQAAIEATATTLLEPCVARGEMDVIADFAFPLPVVVISKMLGFPDAHRAELKRWSKDLLAAIDLRESKAETEDCFRRGARAAVDFSAYVRDHIADRRRHRGHDLLSELIDAGDDADRLSEDELVATCILLLWAGHETTVNLIGNGLFALVNHRDQLDWLREDPARMSDAIEELLRYDSPAQMTFRFALAETAIGDRPIHFGDSIAVVIGAANRDPALCPDPETLDLRRGRTRHLSFGAGAHYCLGAYLARLEGSLAFQTLLRMTADISLTSEPPTWNRSIGLRGLERFPLRLTPAR